MLDDGDLITNWVATKICTAEKLHDRVSLLRFFTLLSQELLSLQNYHGFVSVIEGMNSGPVKRLSKTFESFETRDPKEYSLLQEFVYQTQSIFLDSLDGVAIPHLKVVIKNLESYRDIEDNISPVLFNWQKRRLVSKFIRDVLELKKHQPNIREIPSIIMTLEKEESMKIDKLYSLSYRIEPAEYVPFCLGTYFQHHWGKREANKSNFSPWYYLPEQVW